MQIRSLGYDSEADELDLLIDAEAPIPAESVPVGEGVYVRCDPSSERVVGAFIRGYSHLLKKIRAGSYVSDEEAEQRGLREVFQAILQWVRDYVRPERAFQQVEGVVRTLQKDASRRDDARGVEGEVKRVATMLAYGHDSRTTQELVRRLTAQKDFHRTKQTQHYFAAAQAALQAVHDLPPSEQAYRLGWACRLLKYEALKREQQQSKSPGLQRERLPRKQSLKGGKRR